MISINCLSEKKFSISIILFVHVCAVGVTEIKLKYDLHLHGVHSHAGWEILQYKTEWFKTVSTQFENS